jgi:hypothetical protein
MVHRGPGEGVWTGFNLGRGFRSDGRGGVWASGGGGSRLAAAARRRRAAGLAGDGQCWPPGHQIARGKHQDEEEEAGKITRGSDGRNGRR